MTFNPKEFLYNSQKGNILSGLLIFLIIFVIAVIGIQIWGILAAAKTLDTEINVGKLLLHLFLFGGVVAAIVYAIQAKK